MLFIMSVYNTYSSSYNLSSYSHHLLQISAWNYKLWTNMQVSGGGQSAIPIGLCMEVAVAQGHGDAI